VPVKLHNLIAGHLARISVGVIFASSTSTTLSPRRPIRCVGLIVVAPTFEGLQPKQNTRNHRQRFEKKNGAMQNRNTWQNSRPRFSFSPD
jgi:hypothetical protein